MTIAIARLESCLGSSKLKIEMCKNFHALGATQRSDQDLVHGQAYRLALEMRHWVATGKMLRGATAKLPHLYPLVVPLPHTCVEDAASPLVP